MCVPEPSVPTGLLEFDQEDAFPLSCKTNHQILEFLPYLLSRQQSLLLLKFCHHCGDKTTICVV